jgi:hypothetical protein
MVAAIVKLPFSFARLGLGIIFSVLSAGIRIVLGVVRFLFSHTFGLVFGALAGLVLGKRHVGIRLFTRKRRR